MNKQQQIDEIEARQAELIGEMAARHADQDIDQQCDEFLRQRRAAREPVIRKTFDPDEQRQHPQQQAQGWEGWENWLQARLKNFGEAVADVIGEEVGVTERKLRAEIAKLREEIGALRGEMNVVNSISRGEIVTLKKSSDAA